MSNQSLPVQMIRATTSATLVAEAKVKASIGMAVSRLKASFNSFIDNLLSFRPFTIMHRSI